jgi:dihydrofolate reductase
VRLVLVAAVADGGVIGRNGAIPWHLPEDVAHFRELTMGHPVVMGRLTWESIPERFRPLPGRRNIVVTRRPDWAADGAERAGSLDEALGLVADEDVAFVIGGAQLYADALAVADELALTEVELAVGGDTFFPRWDRMVFFETARDQHVAADGTAYSFVTYERA